jgi:hypothetical protein
LRIEDAQVGDIDVDMLLDQFADAVNSLKQAAGAAVAIDGVTIERAPQVGRYAGFLRRP